MAAQAPASGGKRLVHMAVSQTRQLQVRTALQIAIHYLAALTTEAPCIPTGRGLGGVVVAIAAAATAVAHAAAAVCHKRVKPPIVGANTVALPTHLLLAARRALVPQHIRMVASPAVRAGRQDEPETPPLKLKAPVALAAALAVVFVIEHVAGVSEVALHKHAATAVTHACSTRAHPADHDNWNNSSHKRNAPWQSGKGGVAPNGVWQSTCRRRRRLPPPRSPVARTRRWPWGRPPPPGASAVALPAAAAAAATMVWERAAAASVVMVMMAAAAAAAVVMAAVAPAVAAWSVGAVATS